jgi:NRPS condensation-like uncharacterized protein
VIGPHAIPERFPAASADQAAFLLRGGCDMQTRVVIALAGRIDDARLARALRLVMDAEPVLGCRFVERWWRPIWERRDDLDELDLTTVVPTTAETAEERLQEVLVGEADPAKLPQIRALVLRGETDTIVLKHNHEVADGVGTQEILALWAGFYRALAADPGVRATPNLGSRSMRQIARAMTLRDKAGIVRRSFRDGRKRRTPPGNWRVPSRDGEPIARRFVLRRVEGERFRQVVAFAGETGVSVNDVLVAAYFRALKGFARPDPNLPARMRMPANLRRHLPSGKGEAVCNLSSGFVIHLGNDVGATLADTARKVFSEIRSQVDDYIGLGDWALLPLVFHGVPYAWLRRLIGRTTERIAKNPLPPHFSNVGRLTAPEFGGPAVTDVAMLGPVLYPPHFEFVVSGFGESLTASAGFCETGITRQEVGELIDRFVGELPG